jgi:hypothetical protein
MKNKGIILGTLAVALLGVIAFATTKADAYRGDYTQVGPNHTEEREAEMEKVFEDLNYEGWKTLMTEDGRNPGVLRHIESQEDFEAFVQARELAMEGKTEEANQIREELGMGQGEMRRGEGKGNGSGSMMRDGSCNL